MTRRQRLLLYLTLAIAGVLLVVLMLLAHAVSKKSDQIAQLEDQIVTGKSVTATAVASLSKTATAQPTATLTSNATSSPTVTATVDPNRDLNSVKAVVANFMQAYVIRSLEQAKPYVTDEFFQSFTSEDFAGVSSPSRSGYEIVSAEVVQEGKKYSAKTYLHLELNGEPSGTQVLEFDVIKKEDKFLVSSMSQTD